MSFAQWVAAPLPPISGGAGGGRRQRLARHPLHRLAAGMEERFREQAVNPQSPVMVARELVIETVSVGAVAEQAECRLGRLFWQLARQRRQYHLLEEVAAHVYDAVLHRCDSRRSVDRRSQAALAPHM